MGNALDVRSTASYPHGPSRCGRRGVRGADRAWGDRFTARHLTMVPDKTKYYVPEERYRAALRALVPRGVDTEREAELGARIQRIGLGVFRPDAIAFDRVEPTLDYLRCFDIHPFHAQIVNVSGSIVRELWRYQLNAASKERQHLLDLVFEAGDSILVFFRRIEESPVPCAVLMADVKGPAMPSRREAWQLRSFLGSPNRVEVYFHTSDEPADVVREGAILLGPDLMAQVLRPHLMDAEWRDATDDVHCLSKTLGSMPVPPLRDPFLARVAEECGAGGSTNDRWAVLRTLGERCPMFSGVARNLVRHTGSREWWERSSVAAERTSLLAGAAPEHRTAADVGPVRF